MNRVGVFDSGFGGLTVLRELLTTLPDTDFVYLGDTARLPYGSKSRETIVRYAVSAAKFLEDQGAQYLVIACNTASAIALPELQEHASVPVLGVIETGAEAARQHSATGDVLVIATEATVSSGAYSRALANHSLRAVEKACPLLVPLVEEGWQQHDVTRQVAAVYLAEAFAAARERAMHPDTLLLGCTHYPLLKGLLQAALPAGVAAVDAAAITAQTVARDLSIQPSGDPATAKFFATDSVAKFRGLGSRFLGREIADVELVRFSE